MKKRATPTIAGLEQGLQDGQNPIQAHEMMAGKRPEYQIGYVKGFKEGQEKLKNKYYALIDDGHFSGKPDFVYVISTNRQRLQDNIDANIGSYIIEITKEEYDYLLPQIQEIGYFKDGKTITEKFYY